MSSKCPITKMKCPKHSDTNEGGCPCYWEIPYENEQTGENTVRKGCILSQEMGLPIVQSIVRSAHVSSEHASEARNSADNMNQTVRAVMDFALEEREKQQKGITTGKE